MSETFQLPCEIEAKRKAETPPSSPKEAKHLRHYDTFALPQEQTYVTLKNESGVCYLNVIIFNLFYLEPFRKYVMNEMVVGGSPLLKLLRDIFEKMATRRYECDVRKIMRYLSDHALLDKSGGGDPIAVQATLFTDLQGLRKPFKRLLPVFAVMDLDWFFRTRMYDPNGTYDGSGTNLEYYDRSLSTMELRDRYATYHTIESEMLFFVLRRENPDASDILEVAHLLHLDKFTFPMSLEIYGRWYELYSVYIHDFEWKGIGGHALILIRGKWDGQEPSWRLFSDTEVGSISQERMERMSFGGREHLGVGNLKVAQGLLYVDSHLYDEKFHWDLNDPAFRR